MGFNIGDVVCLNSGGPEMTVKTIEGDTVFCVWFDEDRKMQGSNFKAQTLTKSDIDPVAFLD
jgi:uncharacterized protein YodC (DUF2158 family)